MRNSLLVALLCCMPLSCVSTHTTMFNQGSQRLAVTPNKVVIYTSADKVPGKYEELAILTSQGAYTVAGDDKFYESFRKEAAKIGANGVIISAIEDPSTGQKVGSAVLGALLIPNTMANRKTHATAIYLLPKPLSSEEVAAQDALATDRLRHIDSLDSVVHSGVTRQAMFGFGGPPTKSVVALKSDGHVTETATYVGSGGRAFTIVLTDNVVSSVTRN